MLHGHDLNLSPLNVWVCLEKHEQVEFFFLGLGLGLETFYDKKISKFSLFNSSFKNNKLFKIFFLNRKKKESHWLFYSKMKKLLESRFVPHYFFFPSKQMPKNSTRFREEQELNIFYFSFCYFLIKNLYKKKKSFGENNITKV